MPPIAGLWDAGGVGTACDDVEPRIGINPRLPPEVTASRLVLRRWTPADAAILSSAVVEGLEHLRPWMWWAAQEPLDHATRRQALECDWSAGGDVIYGMFEHDQVVGEDPRTWRSATGSTLTTSTEASLRRLPRR